jgi:hypothetical protein
MQVTESLKWAVQQVLVDMAMNFELDGDINALDIDTVFEKAEGKIKEDDLLNARHEAEVLTNYISWEVNPTSARLKLIGLAQSGKGNDLVDHHFTPSEMFEGTFTVKDMLDLIKL